MLKHSISGSDMTFKVSTIRFYRSSVIWNHNKASGQLADSQIRLFMTVYGKLVVNHRSMVTIRTISSYVSEWPSSTIVRIRPLLMLASKGRLLYKDLLVRERLKFLQELSPIWLYNTLMIKFLWWHRWIWQLTWWLMLSINLNICKMRSAESIAPQEKTYLTWASISCLSGLSFTKCYSMLMN